MTEAPKRTILVLDDDRIQHLLFRKKIGILKIDVDLVFFEEADSALIYIENSPPDIVVSDINLNKMDGWEFLKKVRGLDFEGKFYLLSGSILSDDKTRAKQDASISGFFEKPIQESDLICILDL